MTVKNGIFTGKVAQNDEAQGNPEGLIVTSAYVEETYTVKFVLNPDYTDAGFLSNAGGGIKGGGAVYSEVRNTVERITSFGVVFTSNSKEVVKNVTMTLVDDVTAANGKGPFPAGTQISVFNNGNACVDYNTGFGHALFPAGATVTILVTPDYQIAPPEEEAPPFIPDVYFPPFVPGPVQPEESEKPEATPGPDVDIPEEEVPGADVPETGVPETGAPETGGGNENDPPAPAPLPSVPVGGGTVDIPDEDTPLGDLPQTGDGNTAAIWLSVLIVSGLAAGALVFAGRKRSA